MTSTPTYRAFRARLVAGFALLVVLLAVLLYSKIQAGYDAARAAAYTQTKSFANAMSAHVASEMRLVDLSLIRSAEALGVLDQAKLTNGAQVRRVLALSASVVDANFWIDFVDLQGLGVAASNALPVAGVSYADRAYFQASAGRCDAGLHVGTPDIGRVSKRKLFFLSRPVCTPGGVLLGVVVASVDARVISTVFDSALIQPTLSITLLHGSGRVIARAPLFERAFGQDIRTADFYRNWQLAPAGSYKSRSVVDGQIRVVSYQAVGRFPLAVAVGVATDSWMAAIRNDLAFALGALAVIAAALVFSSRSLLRSFRRVERSDAGQRSVNAELRATRDDMARVAKRLRMIADSLPALVSYIDAQQRYVFHNSFYHNVPGVDVGRMIGRTMREVLGPEIYSAIDDQVREVLTGTQVKFGRAMKVGTLERWVEYHFTPDIDASGAVLGFYSMVLDVSHTKEVEARLSALARIDKLTGLPNRNHLYERLGEALARSRRGGRPCACLYLDIDHFKAINDSLGHAGGDQVLVEFAQRLRASVRETDLVARLGGDEFVIVMEGADEAGGALLVAANIIAAMRAPWMIEGALRTISTSIGIAISKTQDDVDAVLKNADLALYEAKRAGRGGFALAGRA
ncbi:sensor domain-containing diguanylate cyclase [Massilia sp. S19_KUP03_FR1]|uniref:sensor domain-containing diguanylate cyclase n=1 Tax=Massilia sp. S19_KUP03_FR1 TaxID=3025503 RepID=UPI002FCDB3BD